MQRTRAFLVIHVLVGRVMRVANINTNIWVMKRRIQMKTSAQMGHKYIVGPPWINGKPGCDSLDGTQDNMCGVNIWKYCQTRLFVGKMFGNIGMYERHYVK